MRKGDAEPKGLGAGTGAGAGAGEEGIAKTTDIEVCFEGCCRFRFNRKWSGRGVIERWEIRHLDNPRS